MAAKINQPWVPLEKIEEFIQLEPALIIAGLAIGAWITSRVLLRDLSEERKRNLSSLFKNLGYHLALSTGFYLAYFTLEYIPHPTTLVGRLTTYVGLLTIFSGAVVFVKVWRILVFEYFFLSHMRVAFPVLLVNLLTLLLSIFLAGWIGADIFNIRLAPLLATSAIFSLVLGLALQDTLGNLFAGVALQFDKPYEIGDWVEVENGGQKWVGQVYEISWRATILIAFTEEAITVPNRIMSQAKIANFSTKYRPIIRNQVFRVPFGSDVQEVKNILIRSIKSIPDIRKSPSPLVLVSETNESWVGFKLIYYIDNYGEQYLIADEVLSRALKQLDAAGIKLASHRLLLEHEQEKQEVVSTLHSHERV